jgi:hypothetical protein
MHVVTLARLVVEPQYAVPVGHVRQAILKQCSLPREAAGGLQITISAKALWLSTRRSRSSNCACMLLTLATLLGVV